MRQGNLRTFFFTNSALIAGSYFIYSRGVQAFKRGFGEETGFFLLITLLQYCNMIGYGGGGGGGLTYANKIGTILYSD